MMTADLRQLRTDIRRAEFAHTFPDDWDRGGCSVVSEEVRARYGYGVDGGCYLTSDGRHIAHVWNVLPDGRILDVTADSFSDGGDVRITEAHDPRYDGTCGCGEDG